MASTASPMGVSAFFSASEARIDRWRMLNRIARALAAAGTRPPAGPGEDLRAHAAQGSTPRGASPCPLGWCSARDNGSPEQEAR